MAIRLRSNYRGTPAGSDPFTDLLFNVLLGFIMLFFIAILYLNPAKDSGKIDIDAEYVISVTWPDGSPDDIDTWIQDPAGNLTWFRNPSSGLVHLDRDDRGMLNDTQQVAGETIVNPLNQEIVAIRGLLAGEYIVNVHYYDSATKTPVPVSVKVAKVNPVYSIIHYGQTLLSSQGDEATAIRFTLAADGSVGNTNKLPKNLVPR